VDDTFSAKSESFNSRLRPLARQMRPLTTKIPSIRDQYSGFVSIVAGGLVVPVRGAVAGAVVGGGVYGALSLWKEVDSWEN